jgi:serine-type D-Ala-D-Ala carboxypeptidase (penicillin-binding protein 5/6)
MARALRSDKVLAKIVDSQKATLESGARERTVINRNRLLQQYAWVDGIKTGHTSDAGYSLVGSGKRGAVRVISVALGTPSESARDNDSIKLLRYGVGQFRKARAIAKGKVVGTADVKFFDDKSVDIVTAKGFSLIVRRGEKVTRKLSPLPEELEGPKPAGTPVGTMTITYKDRVVKKIPLVTADSAPAAGTLRKAYSEVGPTGTAVAFLTLALIFGLTALRINAVRRRRKQVARAGRRR